MSRWIYFISLSVLSLVLLLASVFILKNKDREEPQIRVPETEIVYTEGDSTSGLLDGVTALDDKDGDLTEHLFVYEVIPIFSGDKAKVIYAVCDSSGNTAMEERMVNYERKKEILQKDNEDAPLIGLRSYGATISKGESFVPREYVDFVQDEKDEEEDLLRQLSVKGNYDLSKTGHYHLQFFVRDSDGYESNHAEFMLVVE